ncbi:hypothetical protein ACF0H5_017599 [Mactra antiquata]
MKQMSTRLSSHQFHKWLIPEKHVMALLSLGIILIFVGAVLLAVSSVASGALAIVGGILLGIGIIFLLICTCLCAHACCVWYVRDEGTQTLETTVIAGDQTDGEWYSTYGLSADKRAPNGVLRDGKQSNTLTKKHVTISPTSNDSFSSSGYTSGRQADSMRSNGVRSQTSVRSEPDSATSDMSTLASFAYLNDPSLATPYSSLNQRRQVQGGAVQVPVNVQGNYGTAQRSSDMGRTAQVRPYHSEGHVRSNVLPARRHSDDDYDNAGDVTALLPHQTYQPSQWQQHPQMSPWQLQQQQQQQQQQHNQQHQQNLYNQQWQSNQPPPQQTVWQYQNTGNQSNWRQGNTGFEDPPPPQPLVQPSQRRPMTFEQISSSKVSLYDNMQMNRMDDDE